MGRSLNEDLAAYRLTEQNVRKQWASIVPACDANTMISTYEDFARQRRSDEQLLNVWRVYLPAINAYVAAFPARLDEIKRLCIRGRRDFKELRDAWGSMAPEPLTRAIYGATGQGGPMKLERIIKTQNLVEDYRHGDFTDTEITRYKTWLAKRMPLEMLSKMAIPVNIGTVRTPKWEDLYWRCRLHRPSVVGLSSRLQKAATQLGLPNPPILPADPKGQALWRPSYRKVAGHGADS